MDEQELTNRVDNYSDEGLDILDILKVYSRKQHAFQFLMLSALEEVIKDKALYLNVRKIVLDYMNDMGRSFSRAIVGEDTMER